MLKSLWNWSRIVRCWDQQKLFKESARDVEKGKSNTRQCSLATLGNLLLPEAREELPRNQLILLGHVGLRFAPYVVTQFALLRLIDLCPKEIQRFVFFVSRGSLIAIGKINTKWDLWVISI